MSNNMRLRCIAHSSVVHWKDGYVRMAVVAVKNIAVGVCAWTHGRNDSNSTKHLRLHHAFLFSCLYVALRLTLSLFYLLLSNDKNFFTGVLVVPPCCSFPSSILSGPSLKVRLEKGPSENKATSSERSIEMEF